MENTTQLTILVENNSITNFFNKFILENSGIYNQVITFDNCLEAINFLKAESTLNNIPETIFILYFCIEFADNENTTHPLDNLIHAVQIWVLFVLFTKMTVPFTIIAFILLCSIYIIKQFIRYYNSGVNIDYISKIGTLEYITHILTNITFFTLILGVILYLHKQYKSHRSNFSILKFIFGSIKCDSMK